MKTQGHPGPGAADLTVREMRPGEERRVIGYFHGADSSLLATMGVDPARLPAAEPWSALIRKDFERPLEERQLYYLFWELDGQAVGHSNINQIRFQDRAFMHLHLWEAGTRQRGLGREFVRQCIHRYFEVFGLDTLLCEPRAANPGPNRTLAGLGFTLDRTYETVPGWINYRQTVNRWRMRREDWGAVDKPLYK